MFLNPNPKFCLGIDHFQGPGKITPHLCNVQFRLFRPLDLIACPYIIWTSHGEHLHPPPPPSRTPTELVNGLIQTIQRIQDPSLTIGNVLLIHYKYIANCLKLDCSRIH